MARPKKRELDLNDDKDYAEHIRRLNQVEPKKTPLGRLPWGFKTPIPKNPDDVD